MTERLELPLRYRRELDALLREHVPEAEVWAYGSRVSGESHPASDLDLVLRGPSLERLGHGVSDLLEALEDSNIPILVQAHDWARLPKSFHREFERDYVVIAERDDRATTRAWLRTTLGEVITLQRGFDLPKSKRIDGPFPVIASTGPVGTHEEAKVKGPGVVIGRSGSLGGGQYIESSFWPLNTTLWVKDFKGNDHRFCYYLLRSLDLAQFNVGSGVPTLNRNHVHPLPVFLPPLPEQRAIARVLGTLDDKIELNRRMNETLEEMARALFKSWFVDFEPVRAKMEGRDTGLPPDIADLFPDSLVPSELGEIPEGWEVKALGELCTLRAGSAFPRTSQGRRIGKYPFAKVSDMNLPTNSICMLDAANWVADDDLAQLKAKPFPHDTTVFAKIGEAIKRNRLRLLVRPTLIDNNMMGAIPNVNVVEPLIFHYALSKFDFAEIAGGTALPYLTANTLYALTLPVPPLSEQMVMAHTLRSLSARSISNSNESHTLAAQRDALLPRLVSGKCGWGGCGEDHHRIRR